MGYLLIAEKRWLSAGDLRSWLSESTLFIRVRTHPEAEP